MNKFAFFMMAFDRGGGGGKGDNLAEVAREWAPEVNWTGKHGTLDFDVPSPTADNETLGQSLRRLGDDIYREIQQPGRSPNRATLQECKDLAMLYPEVGTWFNKAAEGGFDHLQQIADPIQLMIEAMTVEPGTPATHPIGDVNPRYQSLVGDVVNDTGGPTVGKFSSTTYSDR